MVNISLWYLEEVLSSPICLLEPAHLLAEFYGRSFTWGIVCLSVKFHLGWQFWIRIQFSPLLGGYHLCCPCTRSLGSVSQSKREALHHCPVQSPSNLTLARTTP